MEVNYEVWKGVRRRRREREQGQSRRLQSVTTVLTSTKETVMTSMRKTEASLFLED